MRRCPRCGQEKPEAMFTRLDLRRAPGQSLRRMVRVDGKWCVDCYNERYAEIYNLQAFGASQG